MEVRVKFSFVRRGEQNFAAIPIGLRAKCILFDFAEQLNFFARLFHWVSAEFCNSLWRNNWHWYVGSTMA